MEHASKKIVTGIAPASVEIRDLFKRFGKDVVAVDHVDLHIGRGELVTLLGPSGCGKTTILRMIAGLERPTSGRILLDDDDVTRLPAYLRDITMVFQSYALFPHMNVFENVAYGVRVAKRPKEEIAERVTEALEMVGLAEYEARPVTALSGGQQQRVALARALVIRPRVLLFDEPLSNLDAKLRKRVREEIRDLQQRLGITSVYVTHDQEEALAISDRVVVIREGVIEQIGNPHQLYTEPETRFVADFIGSANFLPGQWDGSQIDLLGYRRPHEQDFPPGPVTVMVRPEAVEFARDGESGLEATFVSSAYLGPMTEFVFDVAGQELFATMTGGGLSGVDRGASVRLRLKEAGVSLLPAS
ncbi:ferric ABC transporter ATP-binding protein [soil metagenome]|nr:ABC transporter ATP-binding protein [Trueperaceae bacterium]